MIESFIVKMRKMKLVPVDDDVQVKMLNETLVANKNIIPSPPILEQVQKRDIAVETHIETQEGSTQTDVLLSILIRRYSDLVNDIIDKIKEKNFHWSAQFKLRALPDTDVVHLIEYIACSEMRRSLAINSPMKQIYSIIFPEKKKPQMIELYEDVTPPPPKRNRSSPAAEAHRLRKLAKAQQEARLAAFDKATTIRGPFK